MKIWMKKIRGVATVVVLLLVVSSVWASAIGSAPKDPILEGTEKFAQGAKESNEVNMDKNTLALMNGMNGSKNADQKQADIAQQMDFIYVRSYEYAEPGKYKMSDLEVFHKRLSGDNWSHVVSSHEEKEQSDVWVRTDSEGRNSEMVVISAEPKELSFVHLKGRMSLKDLGNMGTKFGASQSVPELKSRK